LLVGPGGCCGVGGPSSSSSLCISRVGQDQTRCLPASMAPAPTSPINRTRNLNFRLNSVGKNFDFRVNIQWLQIRSNEMSTVFFFDPGAPTTCHRYD
jgi:hypothetical protein